MYNGNWVLCLMGNLVRPPLQKARTLIYIIRIKASVCVNKNVIIIP